MLPAARPRVQLRLSLAQLQLQRPASAGAAARTAPSRRHLRARASAGRDDDDPKPLDIVSGGEASPAGLVVGSGGNAFLMDHGVQSSRAIDATTGAVSVTIKVTGSGFLYRRSKLNVMIYYFLINIYY